MTEKEIISNDSSELINESSHTEVPVDSEVKNEEFVASNDENGTEENLNEEEVSNKEPSIDTKSQTEISADKVEGNAELTDTKNQEEIVEKVPEVETSKQEVTEDSKAEVKEAPEKPASEQRDNVAYLHAQIEKLITYKDEKNFSDFWFYVRELNKMVFTMRGVQKEERQKFKERIGELCDEAKKLQEEYKTKVSKTSSLKLDRIRALIDEALAFGTSHEELEKSFQKIEEVNKFFREGKVQSEEGEESADMSREDKEQAKELIKAGKDKILDRKRAIREGNFKTVTDKLNSISDQLLSSAKPHKIFDAIKKLRIDMKQMILDRSQLREIDDVIETIWKKAREKSSASRVHDTKKKMDGLEDLMRRKERFIQTLEKEIKDLKDKWDNVKNDFFKNRVNEWIEEKKEKIESTYKEIDSVREKINFLNEQMKRN